MFASESWNSHWGASDSHFTVKWFCSPNNCIQCSYNEFISFEMKWFRRLQHHFVFQTVVFLQITWHEPNLLNIHNYMAYDAKHSSVEENIISTWKTINFSRQLVTVSKIEYKHSAKMHRFRWIFACLRRSFRSHITSSEIKLMFIGLFRISDFGGNSTISENWRLINMEMLLSFT